jgi:excisionase family DNA binding protein
MDRLLLTPTEAARALGIGRSKLYELLRTEVIPSVRIGTCRRIAAEDLVAAIQRMRQAGNTDRTQTSREAS